MRALAAACSIPEAVTALQEAAAEYELKTALHAKAATTETAKSMLGAWARARKLRGYWEAQREAEQTAMHSSWRNA